MAVSSKASGSQAATVGTEHTLGSPVTDAGTYVLVVDTANMLNGDVVELRIYTKARAGSASRLAYSVSYAHAQGEPNKYSVPVPVANEVTFTLKQVAGTGRSYDWNILVL